MPRTFAIAFVGLTWLVVPPAIADGCSCLGGVPLCQTVPMTDVIFEGTVESINTRSFEKAFGDRSLVFSERVVRFRDVKALKGESQAVVHTAAQESACGYSFSVGKRYVIAAYKAGDGSLSTGICSLTKPIEEADELLAFMRTLSAPSRGARLSGSIEMPVGIPESEKRTRVPRARVTLTGPVERAAIADEHGEFVIQGLPPGDYELSVAPPVDRPELTGSRVAPMRVRLPDAHSCAVLTYILAFDGRLEGLVIDAERRPLAGAAVQLKASAETRPFAYRTARADATGHYRFDELPPGRYQVGINIATGPTPESPFEMTALTSGGEQRLIVLGAGKKHMLPPLVGVRARTVVVTGSVRLSDGTPATRVNVLARPLGAGSISIGPAARAITDDGGR